MPARPSNAEPLYRNIRPRTLLLPAAKLDKVADVIELARASRLACPACAAPHLCRHGRANGLQRYRCRNCGRTCNALSGTPLARLRHKGRWLDYLDAMFDSRSVRRLGPITASVLAAEVGDGKQYRCGRDFGASIGLVARQYKVLICIRIDAQDLHEASGILPLSGLLKFS